MVGATPAPWTPLGCGGRQLDLVSQLIVRCTKPNHCTVVSRVTSPILRRHLNVATGGLRRAIQTSKKRRGKFPLLKPVMFSSIYDKLASKINVAQNI